MWPGRRSGGPVASAPVLALVLDTATSAVTAAVVRGGQVLAQRVTVDARAHAEVLTPSLQACLDEAGVAAAELDVIVCGTGPGPYTGLRVGMVTAAAWGDVLGVGVHGVCSLDGIAGHCAATDHPGELLVVTDARRREVYWARYADGVRVEGPGVCAPAVLELGSATAVAGSAAHAALLGLPVLGPEHPDPAALVRAAHLTAADLTADPPPFLPRYLRRPDAVPPPGLVRP